MRTALQDQHQPAAQPHPPMQFGLHNFLPVTKPHHRRDAGGSGRRGDLLLPVQQIITPGRDHAQSAAAGEHGCKLIDRVRAIFGVEISARMGRG